MAKRIKLPIIVISPCHINVSVIKTSQLVRIGRWSEFFLLLLPVNNKRAEHSMGSVSQKHCGFSQADGWTPVLLSILRKTNLTVSFEKVKYSLTYSNDKASSF